MRTTIPNTNIENTDSRNTVLPEGEYLNRNITITLIIGLVWSILLRQTVPKITFGDTELTQLVYSSTFLIAQGLISAYLTYLSIKYYTKKNTKYLIFNKNIYKNLLIVIVVILLLGVILGISI